MYKEKNSKSEIVIASMGVALLVSMIAFMFYSSLTRDSYFEKSLKENLITVVRVEDVLNVRNNYNISDTNCPYQINFIGLNANKEKIRAKYCAGNYVLTGTIQVREKI